MDDLSSGKSALLSQFCDAKLNRMYFQFLKSQLAFLWHMDRFNPTYAGCSSCGRPDWAGLQRALPCLEPAS